MKKRHENAEKRKNLHAPWRAEYLDTLSKGPGKCFLCRCRDDTSRRELNLVLWHTRRCLVVMNRFPYAGGHLLVAPNRHVGRMESLPEPVLTEMMQLARDCTLILKRAIRAEGFNIGVNIGRCAGAGLPGHIHLHVVPRWSGDTNFMSTLGDVRVIPQSLPALREQLLKAADDLHLPQPCHAC